MIVYGVLVARLCLAIVFLYSAVDKLRHWRSSIEEVRGDGLPWPAAFAAATVFTGTELTTSLEHVAIVGGLLLLSLVDLAAIG
jgi:putative oxidoreductase